MAFGKTIKIFIIDGEINGRLTCELSNWTGKAYKIPRGKINISSDREDLNKAGVYLLFGKADDDNFEGEAYIGEAENIYSRLKQHLNEKDFWYDSIIIISKDDNLNKAHIKFLENKLYELGTKSKRYKILNDKRPQKPSISESDEAEMEEFIYNIKILVSTLGYKIFDESSYIIKENKENELFYINSTRGANASGKRVTDGFLVFKDSEISKETVKSYFESMDKLREKLIKENIIIEKNGKLIFCKDYIFSSPSTAAMIVMGRSANGKTEWKLESGKSLKDIEEKT